MARRLSTTLLGLLMLSTSVSAQQQRAATTPDEKPAKTAAAPETLRLWSGDVPGAQGSEEADIPTITVYKPEKANGAAVVVCPGGGYGGLAGHEGKPVAEWLNSLGVTGFVLKYRLGPKYHHPVELGDVGRAIRTVRANAKEWGLDARRVGVLGFSAGGHLASTAATHFDDGDARSDDPVERVSSRPDVAILIYPVISLHEPLVHTGSRRNLLGDQPDPSLVDLLSNDQQVTDKTPPCFLVHTADDGSVPVGNSIAFALACQKNHVPYELHVFEHGPHGFGLGRNDAVLNTWPADAARWLQRHKFAQVETTTR